jgi:hypothetical protein
VCPWFHLHARRAGSLEGFSADVNLATFVRTALIVNQKTAKVPGSFTIARIRDCLYNGANFTVS